MTDVPHSHPADTFRQCKPGLFHLVHSRLPADITSGDGLVEFALLPTVAGIEAAGEDGLLTGQVEIFTLIAVCQRFGNE